MDSGKTLSFRAKLPSLAEGTKPQRLNILRDVIRHPPGYSDKQLRYPATTHSAAGPRPPIRRRASSMSLDCCPTKSSSTDVQSSTWLCCFPPRSLPHPHLTPLVVHHHHEHIAVVNLIRSTCSIRTYSLYASDTQPPNCFMTSALAPS
jgi:hypothetical protein